MCPYRTPMAEVMRFSSPQPGPSYCCIAGGGVNRTASTQTRLSLPLPRGKTDYLHWAQTSLERPTFKAQRAENDWLTSSSSELAAGGPSCVASALAQLSVSVLRGPTSRRPLAHFIVQRTCSGRSKMCGELSSSAFGECPPRSRP